MLNAIQGGVLSVALNARKLQFYKGGIMNSAKCASADNFINHGVALVGYDTTSNPPYWILRNSWGSDWGEEGYECTLVLLIL